MSRFIRRMNTGTTVDVVSLAFCMKLMCLDIFSLELFKMCENE